VGIETYSHLAHAWHDTIMLLNDIILAIFIFEIVVKMVAEWPRPLRYFKDAWNVFDFVIVAACFVPGMGQYALVLRLLRLLRVLKLLNAIPKLQILVGALLRSIPSMFYVSVLLFLLFYVYAVAGVFLFGVNDPYHFGDLQNSLLSLFRGVTLEDWTDLMYIQMYGCEEYPSTNGIFRPGPAPLYDPGFVVPPETTRVLGGAEVRGWATGCYNPQANWWLGMSFFVSFVLLGTMVILNLFIGVIMNGMDEATAESERLADAARRVERGDAEASVAEDLDALLSQLDALRVAAAKLRDKLDAPG